MRLRVLLLATASRSVGGLLARACFRDDAGIGQRGATARWGEEAAGCGRTRSAAKRQCGKSAAVYAGWTSVGG